jgi:PQQ-like domain
MRTWNRPVALFALCATAVFATVSVGIGTGSQSAMAAASSATALDVVGGPIGAGSSAVVISVNNAHNLSISGIDPVSEKVVWQHPYSASSVTPGVALTPVAIGNTVLDLSPVGKADPLVTIAGVDATTGSVLWRLAGSFDVSDNPAACASNQAFCVTAYSSDTATTLVLINPTTGTPRALINGPERALGTNLYETDASTPTVEQLSPTGVVAWTKTISSLYGPGYDPDNGWEITPVGNLNVGSVGPQETGKSIDMGASKTEAFDTATGTLAWSIPGSYLCEGPLDFLTSQVTCEYSGTIHQPSHVGQYPSMRGVTLKLAGFNPASGAITWTLPISNVTSFSFGSGIRFLDGTEVSVQLLSGKEALLNTATGVTAPLSNGQALWCEKLPNYKVNVPKGTEGGGMRTSEPLYYPCSVNGKASTKLPTAFPSTVGATVNGVFIWPSPTGLRTHVVGAPQSVA